MPRMARITIPGVAQHVTQRGNYRKTVFLTDGDRRLYLELLGEEAPRCGVSILAYCLMDTHVHLIVVPERADSLARGWAGHTFAMRRPSIAVTGAAGTCGRTGSSRACWRGSFLARAALRRAQPGAGRTCAVDIRF